MTPDSKLVSLQEERTYRETQREQHVRMEAELFCQKPRNAKRSQTLEDVRKDSPLEVLEEAGTMTLDFWLPEL